MIHYGDIKQLKGNEIPIVDCIIGGSPCQDLSVAGKKKGLEGERSGLFMEQIRIIKEMRAYSCETDRRTDEYNGHSRYARPRYMVLENVIGIFSSNKGRDFQKVLTEIIRIAEPNSPDVPMPENGKWRKAGYIYDAIWGGWSVAWRVHDAQFWGVPQRRKRIAVLADFNGLTAGEILFDPQYWTETASPESDKTESDIRRESRSEIQSVCKSVSGNFETISKTEEGTATTIETSVNQTGANEIAPTLNTFGGEKETTLHLTNR
jgi:site-specific DNA-cytosine methylase